jgi:branched-subunit amino acid ABC-type transport system permease component
VELIEALYRGVCSGSLFALLALGLNLPYATTRTFNFAHGQMMVVGSMGGVLLWTSVGLPVLAAAAVIVAGAALLGAVTERLAVRPLGDARDSAGWVLSTFGVLIVVGACLTIVVTRDPGATDTRYFPPFLPFADAWDAGGVDVEPHRLLLVVALAIVAAGLWAFQHRTRTGRALGAVADDREGALLRGLPVGRLAMTSYAIGAGIAALAGFVAGPVTQASLSGGFGLTLSAFIAATVGGIPTMAGAIVGGLVLGVVQQLTVVYADAQLQSATSLALLLGVLLVRPDGLFGRRARSA